MNGKSPARQIAQTLREAANANAFGPDGSVEGA
jgi:hypothetical protein